MAILKVTNLNVSYAGNSILENLSFTVEKGDILAVIGPNGAGKTVLFKALLGLTPFTGQINWAPGIKIGYVPQRLAIEPDLPITVGEFFSFKNASPGEISHAFSDVGFTDQLPLLLPKKLGSLSGGQFQRILIAWALVDHPQVLLFDEPTTGVDISAESSIYNTLHHLQEQEDLTLILISHELQVVYRYATNVLCLNKEGLCWGPPHKALTQKVLSQLFGEHASVYHHQHQL